MIKTIKKITIITLTFNRFELLENTVKSVIRQSRSTDLDIEYIILDDGSDNFDNGLVQKLVAEVKQSDINCKLIINEKNIGTVAALNKAISLSAGEILIPLSSDDEFYDSEVLLDIVNEFNDKKHLLLTALRVPVENNTELKTKPNKGLYRLFNNRDKLLNHILVRGNIISGATTYYHRQVFDKIGFFDTDYRLLEDYPFYIKALSNGIDIGFMPRKVIKYGLDGVSGSGNNAILNSDVAILDEQIFSRNTFGFFGKRYFYYQRYISNTEKTKFRNIISYPEQYILYLIKKIMKWYKP